MPMRPLLCSSRFAQNIIMMADPIAVNNMCESEMDLNREKELKFEYADCKSKLGQKVAVYEGETSI